MLQSVTLWKAIWTKCRIIQYTVHSTQQNYINIKLIPIPLGSLHVHIKIIYFLRSHPSVQVSRTATKLHCFVLVYLGQRYLRVIYLRHLWLSASRMHNEFLVVHLYKLSSQCHLGIHASGENNGNVFFTTRRQHDSLRWSRNSANFKVIVQTTLFSEADFPSFFQGVLHFFLGGGWNPSSTKADC